MGQLATSTRRNHIQQLESESIYVMREVAAQFERPMLLFSGGKDSIVMVYLAMKAFRPGKFPFPLLHIDTGHNFDETIQFVLGNVKEVSFEECIPLELKLNLTRYGKKYRELGNFLYNYKTQYGYSTQPPSTKMVSADELAFIGELRKMNYDELLKNHSENWNKDYYYK